MTGISNAQFGLRLVMAIGMGALVGLERQWRQRVAGTRTNALVAAGAAAFIMCGLLLDNDPSARGRIVSYVVSGVGFLGAGVIFKEGGNVRGLNTAATIWCSAAMGALSGLGALNLALLLAAAVLLTNMVLRPLAYRLHPVLPEATPIETLYEVRLACKVSAAAHIRALLLSTITHLPVTLQSIRGEQDEGRGKARIRRQGMAQHQRLNRRGGCKRVARFEVLKLVLAWLWRSVARQHSIYKRCHVIPLWGATLT
jgi:putative Mg2+ transporter-C (MgtC) family protein